MFLHYNAYTNFISKSVYVKRANLRKTPRGPVLRSGTLVFTTPQYIVKPGFHITKNGCADSQMFEF